MNAELPARILIVDDEEQIRRFLTITLRTAGYEPLQANNGDTALQQCALHSPALILLDLGLPDISGHEVIRRVRKRFSVPIIVLSVRNEDTEKVHALDEGANDYVQKPFSTAELLARIRACLRASVNVVVPVIDLGDLHIDVAAHEVRIGREIIHLSKKEFDLLVLLARTAGRVCTHRQLLENVWGPGHRGDVHYLRIYIAQLRNKLGDRFKQSFSIDNEQGIGYRLRIQEQ
jgi:two-component system KDP operon response regulator KdpE